MAFECLYPSFIVGQRLTCLVSNIAANVVVLQLVSFRITLDLLVKTYIVRDVLDMLNNFWESERQLKCLLLATALHTSVVTPMYTKSRWL